MATIGSTGWLVMLGLAVGCGGATASIGGDGDSGTGDGGSNNDGGGGTDGGGGSGDGAGGGDGGGGSPACPPTPPTGGSCPVNGAECEYGNDPNPACNALVLCESGQWSFPPRGGCPPPGGLCPPTYASVPVGAKCAPEFETCAYPEGTCDCTRSGPVTRQEPAWVCIPVSPGCPSTRPRIGSACSQPGESCNYGACNGGVQLTCKGGYWQNTPVPCPL